MNYEYEEGKSRLLGNSVVNRLNTLKPGAYWCIIYPGSNIDIWYLRTEEEFFFDEARKQGSGYRTFPAKSDLLLYCMLADLQPSKAHRHVSSFLSLESDGASIINEATAIWPY